MPLRALLSQKGRLAQLAGAFKLGYLRNYVGQEYFFQLNDSIFDGELLFLEPLHHHHVRGLCLNERVDSGVKIGMLLPFHRQFQAQLGLLFWRKIEHLPPLLGLYDAVKLSCREV